MAAVQSQYNPGHLKQSMGVSIVHAGDKCIELLLCLFGFYFDLLFV